MWDAYYGLNTTNLVMWLVDDAAATKAANKIWRSISFLCVCVLRYDIDLTDKSFRARVNPQKTSKEKYDNKTSFRSLLWIKRRKKCQIASQKNGQMNVCMCVRTSYLFLFSWVLWDDAFVTPKNGNIILQVIYGKKFPHFQAEDQDAILFLQS